MVAIKIGLCLILASVALASPANIDGISDLKTLKETCLKQSQELETKSIRVDEVEKELSNNKHTIKVLENQVLVLNKELKTANEKQAKAEKAAKKLASTELALKKSQSEAKSAKSLAKKFEQDLNNVKGNFQEYKDDSAIKLNACHASQKESEDKAIKTEASVTSLQVQVRKLKQDLANEKTQQVADIAEVREECQKQTQKLKADSEQSKKTLEGDVAKCKKSEGKLQASVARKEMELVDVNQMLTRAEKARRDDKAKNDAALELEEQKTMAAEEQVKSLKMQMERLKSEC